SPNINLFRDPRWGRGMETYGEDPYLTGRLAVAFIRGLQGDDPRYLKTVATPKHYAVHSGPEPARHGFEALAGERDLRESYLPHFRAAIEEGRAFSVMCAYNAYDGRPCCGSDRLLTGILRREWGFGGYVVSDCDAVNDIRTGHKLAATAAEAAAEAVRAGTDLNCGTEYAALLDAVREGLLTEKDIDVSVKRLFRARFRLGMLDPPERVPYAGIPMSVVDSEAHRRLALEAARKSIVLLKNEGGILPLAKSLRKIAVIGPNAADVEPLLGNYNGTPSNPVTPLQGILDKVAPRTEVVYARGCDPAPGLPSLEVIPSSYLMIMKAGRRTNGLLGEYYPNREFRGDPAFVQVDKKVDFEWWDGAPSERFDPDDFSVRWTGMIVPPESGEYVLGGEGFNSFKLYFEGRLLVEFDGGHHPRKTYQAVTLRGGTPYQIRLDYSCRAGDASIRLLWRMPGRNLRREALDAAAGADAVILCLGLSPRLEGEEMDVPVEGFAGGDRLTLDLPSIQQSLLEAIVKLGRPTVLVLLNGSPLALNGAGARIPAVLEAWYPGQASGSALADVLFGDYNPAGRLPVTFYASASDLPAFSDYAMKGRTYRFFEGRPLFPFGYGLSYTRFGYSRLILPARAAAGEAFDVRIDVRNAGTRAGEEVVQLYVRDKRASVPVPLRSLQGFRRIFLNPGETRTVIFRLEPAQLSLWDESMRQTVEPGAFEVSIGGGQPGTFDAGTGGLTGVIEIGAIPAN
ncbi:MAG: glycoside hydrolase family 3 C-terminal domain-containing protein, partial [Acidobacteriota bacterium]|nr:glycoside hydrolase family 3 C-terminal domain-containing protein [Acidobacteriota bacterium]